MGWALEVLGVAGAVGGWEGEEFLELGVGQVTVCSVGAQDFAGDRAGEWGAFLLWPASWVILCQTGSKAGSEGS